MSVNDQYALNWSNHTSHIRKAFDTLLSENQFVDVTLSCEGKKVVAHKIILSACSTYFHDLFRDNPCQHPIVILKDVKFQNLIDILKFIYNGEVSVSSDNFDSFLKTAELLQISGLTDDDSKQLEEASTTIESNETSSLETTSINLKSSPQPSQSTSTAATSTLTHRVKSPVTKKRPIEITQNEEPAVQRKKRESGLDIEIKEEISESNFEEDELNSIIDIKDPLQLEQQHEESDLSETLPVVGMDSKKRAKRSCIRKRPSLPKEVLEEAVQTVLDKKMSIRGAAYQFNIAKSVLARFVTRAKSEPDNSFIYEPRNRNRNRIFTSKEEDNLIGCLNLISKTTQVLTYQKIREFAFHYAIKLGKEALPKNWMVQRKAGMDWTKVFMNRHQILLVHHQKEKCIYMQGDFIVVKTESAGYAVGEVIQILAKKKITVKILKKLVDSYRFIYPEFENLIDIDTPDIFLKLIKPETDETYAEKSILSFSCDLSNFL